MEGREGTERAPMSFIARNGLIDETERPNVQTYKGAA